MKKIFLIAIVVGALIACNKDKFKTQPQIEITSYNTKEVSPGQDMVIQLKFTDKEGDISNGTFIYVPKRLNIRPVPPDLEYLVDSSVIPTFPDQTSGTFEFRLPWNFLHKSDIENDSIYFSFIAVDRGGNRSDTVNSDKIVILRQ